MRLMSFALTTRQFLDGTKTVTRRLGWRFLRRGDIVMGVKKVMGLKPGERVECLGPIRILSVRRERLDEISPADVSREGFPRYSPEDFVAMFCKHMNCRPHTEVARIEFERIHVLAPRQKERAR